MLINIDDYFYFIPSCRRTIMMPKNEFENILKTCIGKTKYEAEHKAMVELWNKKYQLNLGINHRFQITGNFIKELNGL